MQGYRRRVLLAHLRAARRADHPQLLWYVDEADLDVWYLGVANLGGRCASGEYIFCLRVPPGFPTKPPSLEALTPNGVYGLGGKICISIGEFHADRWRPAIGMLGFAREVLNGMLCPSALGGTGGIRILATPAHLAQSPALAAGSRGYNAARLPKLAARLFGPEAVECQALGQLRRGRKGDALAAEVLGCSAGGAVFSPELWRRVWEELGLPPPALRGVPRAAGLARLCSILHERDVPVRRLRARLLAAALRSRAGEPAPTALKKEVAAMVAPRWAGRVAAAFDQKRYAWLLNLVYSIAQADFVGRDRLLGGRG